jgi:hypothetical protein
MRTESLLPLAPLFATFAACMPTPLDLEDTSPNNDECVQVKQDLIIENDADVLALPQRCFVVPEHTVYVTASDREDLQGLANLREARALRIEGNTLLRTTFGLERVVVKQEVVVADNPVLVDVMGLDPTQELERVTLSDNPSLRDIVGLRNVKRLRTELRIERASNLDTLNGFEQLEEAGNVVIQDTSGLGYVGLPSLVKVVGHLTIARNADLVFFRGLGRLASVGGDFTIDSNAALMSTDGMTAKFQSIMGSLVLTSNPALIDTRDLQNVYMLGGSLVATYNYVLSRCRADDLTYYIEDVGQDVDVGDNSANWDPCY